VKSLASVFSAAVLVAVTAGLPAQGDALSDRIAELARQVAEEFRRVVVRTAMAHGATAEIAYHDYGPALWNDPALGKGMRPSLVRAAGEANVVEVEPVVGGEDFSHYAQQTLAMLAIGYLKSEPQKAAP
jgi:metal-dependent amidase/aminoacylase/carboxypeptidase family protein